MSLSTEAKAHRKKFIDLKNKVSHCNDPYGLLAEFALENERLRNQITRYEKAGNFA